MKSAPPLPNEAERLEALRLYNVLDTPPEEPFDDLTELAALICEAPIALISLIDEDRQWFKSRVGLDATETSRNLAFCAHAIHQPNLFIIEDATRDERFADNPLVSEEPHIRFYAGAPLITPEGHALGTLCVIDREPRQLSPAHQRALRMLSRHVMALLELRRRDLEAKQLREERLRLIAKLEEEHQALEQRVAERTAELARNEQESSRQLALAARSRIALLSVLEDQKQAEAALRESETRYRTLLEKAPFPTVLVRLRDGILLYGNHRAEDQYGISREQGIGLPADQFYQDPVQRQQFVERLQREGRVDDLEVRMRAMDGRPFWALVSASIVDFENEPAIFAAINDISARKHAEAALQEQEAFFRLITENMDDMVAVLDLEGRRLYNSPSCRGLFGDLEVLKGTDSFAGIHPDDREEMRRVFHETIRTGKGQRANFRFLLPNGETRDMESQGGVIRGGDGQVEKVVVVSRDITERKRLENEIHQLNIELEDRVKARTAELAAVNGELETFTYSVSHDLKAPLRGIDGYSRLLLEGHASQLDEEGCLFLNNVRRGVEQMHELIDDLLAYSRMERRDLQQVPMDLPALVAGVLHERQEDIQSREVRVETAMENLSVQADPEGLAMVLRNLLDNALKFSRDCHPASIHISATPKDNSIILAIRDNGIGFDMQFQNRIFDIFQRLQRAEDYPGTGVGLAIVRKAIHRMGGRAWAESAPGQGATFFLELPR